MLTLSIGIGLDQHVIAIALHIHPTRVRRHIHMINIAITFEKNSSAVGGEDWRHDDGVVNTEVRTIVVTRLSRLPVVEREIYRGESLLPPDPTEVLP